MSQIKFQIIKNRNPKAKGGVPDIHTLPCALAIRASTAKKRLILPDLKLVVSNPADFAEMFGRDPQGNPITLEPYQRQFLERIAQTERKERQQ